MRTVIANDRIILNLWNIFSFSRSSLCCTYRDGQLTGMEHRKPSLPIHGRKKKVDYHGVQFIVVFKYVLVNRTEYVSFYDDLEGSKHTFWDRHCSNTAVAASNREDTVVSDRRKSMVLSVQNPIGGKGNLIKPYGASGDTKANIIHRPSNFDFQS